ncbi:Lacal_2735 family protein [Hanstruepera marina]|uniref:Lacal_2735 family protein n=1 Tax=Hanstruepera marina TaxID=2873265 RepID=UPI001CA78F05|nr:Lacal_2735 family protein [Hanstruepera marina]
MKRLTEIKKQKIKLQKRYKQLIEQAYNLRQTDSAESDISEYQAIQLLDKLNRLSYLHRDNMKPSV